MGTVYNDNISYTCGSCGKCGYESDTHDFEYREVFCDNELMEIWEVCPKCGHVTHFHKYIYISTSDYMDILDTLVFSRRSMMVHNMNILELLVRYISIVYPNVYRDMIKGVCDVEIGLPDGSEYSIEDKIIHKMA